MKRINVFLTRNWLRDKIHINIQMQKTRSNHPSKAEPRWFLIVRVLESPTLSFSIIVTRR